MSATNDSIASVSSELGEFSSSIPKVSWKPRISPNGTSNIHFITFNKAIELHAITLYFSECSGWMRNEWIQWSWEKVRSPFPLIYGNMFCVIFPFTSSISFSPSPSFNIPFPPVASIPRFYFLFLQYLVFHVFPKRMEVEEQVVEEEEEVDGEEGEGGRRKGLTNHLHKTQEEEIQLDTVLHPENLSSS